MLYHDPSLSANYNECLTCLICHMMSTYIFNTEHLFLFSVAYELDGGTLQLCLFLSVMMGMIQVSWV